MSNLRQSREGTTPVSYQLRLKIVLWHHWGPLRNKLISYTVPRHCLISQLTFSSKNVWHIFKSVWRGALTYYWHYTEKDLTKPYVLYSLRRVFHYRFRQDWSPGAQSDSEDSGDGILWGSTPCFYAAPNCCGETETSLRDLQSIFTEATVSHSASLPPLPTLLNEFLFY